jgi:hypothetical protein
MATWSEFASARPEMAQVLLDQLGWIPIAYLATVRRDGSPRVHPVCPILAGPGMYVAVAGTSAPDPSPKRFDLARDGRYALHALPGKRDDEFYVTGRARRIEDAATRQAVADAAGHTIRDDDWIFELEIRYAMTAYWEKVGQPGTYPVRTEWRDTAR